MGKDYSAMTLTVVVILLAGCGPQANETTQQKIQQAFSSPTANIRKGILGGQLRVQKGNSSGYFPMSEFSFTPCEKGLPIAFHFYSSELGRCTGTFDGKFVTFNVLQDYRSWSEK